CGPHLAADRGRRAHQRHRREGVRAAGHARELPHRTTAMPPVGGVTSAVRIFLIATSDRRESRSAHTFPSSLGTFRRLVSNATHPSIRWTTRSSGSPASPASAFFLARSFCVRR